MNNKNIWIAIAVILGVILVWWFVTQGNEATAPTNSDGTSMEEVPMDDPTEPIPEGSATNQLPNGDAVAVSNQTAGSFVTVDNFVLSEPGFIVIHEANADGSAGRIVGQSGLLNAGRGQDLELNVSIAAGKSYVA
ncbi:MAG TPA: hypothetical protein PKD34_02825, partial [Candidatus Doudnabacteria bacterium]|nr:hypothetical protein [Candidatus Doudnabacteria bacterium]